MNSGIYKPTTKFIIVCVCICVYVVCMYKMNLTIS